MSVPSDPPRFTPRVVRQCDLDWIKFDATVARDGSIDPVDKALYAALASFVDVEYRDSDPEAGEDDEDIPTRARLAECIGRSLDTVDRATKRLEERGIIRVHRRRDPNNPKRHLPSVYELLDHEWWDERAAARAEARRAAREQGRGGGRTGAARGSRIHAARGSRTSAAVPPSSKKISLSERAQREGEEASVPPPRASAEVDATEERERTAPPSTPAPPKVSSHAQEAQKIAQAWTEGTELPRVPAGEQKIAEQAEELLAEGHSAAHLTLIARWMGQQGWRDLGYALTAKGAPRVNSEPSRGKPEWCGECDEVSRMLDVEDEVGMPMSYHCPKCSPKVSARAAVG